MLPILRQKLGALRHLSRHLPRHSRLILANGMINSRIIYLIQVWGGTETKYLKKIQTILNETARFVTGMPRRTSTRTLMLSCNWLYVCEQVNYHSMILLWNIVNRSTPPSLSSLINVDENCRLSTTRARLQITRTSFRWRSIPLWNDLQDDIRLCQSLPRFKLKLRKWIIEQRPRPG